MPSPVVHRDQLRVTSATVIRRECRGSRKSRAIRRRRRARRRRADRRSAGRPRPALRHHRPARAAWAPWISSRSRCQRPSGDIGALLVAARKLLRATRRNGNPDGPRTGWPGRCAAAEAAAVEPPIGHAQIHRLVGFEIPIDMERQAGEATVVRRALAGQLGADIDFDHAVGEVAMHDGEARPLALRVLSQAAFLLVVGEFDRQTVAAVPMAARRRPPDWWRSAAAPPLRPGGRRARRRRRAPSRHNPGPGRGGPAH